MKKLKRFISYITYFAVAAAGLLPVAARGQSSQHTWLRRLHETIALTGKYDAARLRTIDSLRNHTDGRGSTGAFEYYYKLYEAYAVFNFDSAFAYAQKMHEAAIATGNTSQAGYAQVKMCFTLLSSGMFKEMFDTMQCISLTELSRQGLAEYYLLKARSNFDLADYANGKAYSDHYNSEASRYLDSSLLLLPQNSFASLYYHGLKSIRGGNLRRAAEQFKTLAADSTLSMHERAITYSTYSDLYIRKRMPDSAILLLAKAAISDIQSSTRETSAIFTLATLLFKQRDLENASAFIQKAAVDAKLYGARQRMVQLSSILPLIESERLRTVENDRRNIVRYAIIITILFILLIAMVIVVVSQVRKMKQQQVEISGKNISLHHLVQEKEWLLKEIHHRVKNNLHTISSLLESQSSYLKDDALEAVRGSQHRVFAMSLIHQKLYQPENNIMDIDMVAYLYELVSYLKESFQAGPNINSILQLDPLQLDVSTAVPVGLILNEAITNSLKYAFPKNGNGNIVISMKRTNGNSYKLEILDDGVGLAPGFDPGRTKSLGMKLMKGLSEDINARFSISSTMGTSVSVEFKAERQANQYHK